MLTHHVLKMPRRRTGLISGLLTTKADKRPVAEGERRMRILFYLPVVTPWWFDHIVVPLIRAAARDAEVHVMVPPYWSGTGIRAEQLMACGDLAHVGWHILDGDDHPALRHAADDAVIDMVQALDPDLTLCRSADIDTPAHFPGIVRYIMEGSAPPFANAQTAVHLGTTLFDHGILPVLDETQRACLDDALRDEWTMIADGYRQPVRSAFLGAAGLPADKRIIGLPLEYEHPEMFFAQHATFPDNIALIDHIAPRLDADTILAVTRHPLNGQPGDEDALHAAIAAYGGKVRLVGGTGAHGTATNLLVRHSDGMVVGNSKSFAVAAFFGTPMLRLTKFRTGAWLNAFGDFAAFDAAIRDRAAPGALDARIWFAFHILNTVFDPADIALDGAALMRRATMAVDPARWDAALRNRARHVLKAAA